jgi:hypothetical protein
MAILRGNPYAHRLQGASVLNDVKNELAKLIARDIYGAAKKVPGMARSLKEAALKKSGSGVPEAVLKEFEDVFLAVMDVSFLSDGYAKWRDGQSEALFQFWLTRGMIEQIRKSDWVKAARRSAGGIAQVQACGSDARYQELVDHVVPQMFASAVKACRGVFRDRGNDKGWQVLTPVIAVTVAHKAKDDFALHEIFYMATGSKADTDIQFKRAKKFLLGGLFHKSPAPFEGPYFR